MYEFEELITIEDLCEALNCGKSTAYRLLQEKKLPSFRIGRIYKIPRSAVNHFIYEQAGYQPAWNDTVNPYGL